MRCQVDPSSPPTAAEGVHGVGALGAILGDTTDDTSCELSLCSPPSLIFRRRFYDRRWQNPWAPGQGRALLVGVCNIELLLHDQPDEI